MHQPSHSRITGASLRKAIAEDNSLLYAARRHQAVAETAVAAAGGDVAGVGREAELTQQQVEMSTMIDINIS